IRNMRQRQKAIALLAAKNEELNRNRIQELLRDQELVSIHSMLQGQETERKRIAQDLHDRLGSLLATVKLHFQMAKTDEQRELASSLMDEACQEVRQIAHNMVSGVLMKFGLVAALNDLSNAITSSGKVHMQTIAHGLNSRLPGNSEIEIYRIVQELVSNALKHAGAKEITVLLNKTGPTLNLIVEDDGKGFMPAKAKNKGGMGLKGVQSRVQQLQGELSIDSSPGRGTTVLIEIPVDQTDPLSPQQTTVEEKNHDQITTG
ncbi:MAG: sensor histidine kinase, partial [Sphingobacteriales bacterium]